MPKKFVYCIFCKVKQENKIELILKNMGYNIIPASAERNLIVNGKIKNVLRSIIPGYIFFETYEIVDIIRWKEICEIQDIFFPLKYYDNKKMLRGKDLEFINWVKRNNGIIKISKVVEIGKKIKAVEGPLKDYEGSIIKINKKRKCIAVKIDGEAIDKII
jgi:transcriptional antiterminator NusG